MAILDAFLQFSNAQAVTTTGAATNILDTLAVGQILEKGAWLRVAVQTAFVTGTDLQVQLQTSPNSDFSTTATTLVQSAAIPVATLVAGYEMLVCKIPKNVKRYLRVYYVHTGAAHTAGNVDAHILQDVDVLLTDVEGR
jgi:hypothetical protein